jgi:predicted lipoprotein with Yx(FWY)xxD motif
MKNFIPLKDSRAIRLAASATAAATVVAIASAILAGPGRKITLFIAAAAAMGIALIAAGCGGSASGAPNSSGPYGSAATNDPPDASAGVANVAVANSPLGRILVDAGGRTLYLFQQDTSTVSTCNGSCATSWPPLTTTGNPEAADGVSAAKLGTTKRADGTTEVTYNGHPLYYYAGDAKAGDTTGQGLDLYGAEWNVLSPAGEKIEASG